MPAILFDVRGYPERSENHSTYLFTPDVTGHSLHGYSFSSPSQTRARLYLLLRSDHGGPDINDQSIEPSYPDYRFRTPNILLIHGAYEQSLGKLPIGSSLGVDEAKASLHRDEKFESPHAHHIIRALTASPSEALVAIDSNFSKAPL